MQSHTFIVTISIDSHIFYMLFIGILFGLLYFTLYPSTWQSICKKESIPDYQTHYEPYEADTTPTESRIDFTVGDIMEGIIDTDEYKSTETTDSKGRRVIKHSFGTYEIQEIYGIFTDEECDKMIELGKKNGMAPSHVSSYDRYNTKLDTSSRISSQTWLSDNYDSLTQAFAERTVEITSLPIENQEEAQIASYPIGGKFEEHFDACREGKGVHYCTEQNGTAGDRTATLLVYLNDEFEGGQTIFTALDFKVTPEKGKGILFYNIDEDEKPLPKSLHKGAEILKGEKWIATKWVHPRDFKNKTIN